MDILHGTLLLWRTPRLWPLCLGPLVAAFLLYVVLAIAGFYFVVPSLEHWLLQVGIGGTANGLLGTTVFVVWLLLFPFLFILFGGAFAGLIFEPLSLAVEKLKSGETREPAPALTFGQTILDTVARLFLAVLLGILALVLGIWMGPIPGIVVASILGLLDYTSPVYARRGKTLGPQLRDLFARLDGSTVAFAIGAGLLSLIPFVGLLMLPGMVAGGTLLTLRREAKQK